MDDNGHKSVHIHTGGLIIFIIIIFILFKVNLQSAVNSPQFQSNVAYIEQKGTDIWNKYLSKTVFYVWNTLFSELLKQSFNSFIAPNMKQPDLNTIFKVPQIQNNLGNFNAENSDQSTPVQN